MYLSRVMIDRQNRQKLKDLTHLGAYHNWVEQCFPKEISTGDRLRHLWRIDRIAGQEYLLVLSENKPSTEGLNQYGVAGTAVIKSYDGFLARIKEGQTLRFRLTANPTYAKKVEGKRGQVYAHVTAAQQMAWLSERAAKLGFKLVLQGTMSDNDNEVIEDFEIVDRGYAVLRKKSTKNTRISRVTFEGKLVVTDLEQFLHTLISGIGREKAYGMGLMTVIPVVA